MIALTKNMTICKYRPVKNTTSQEVYKSVCMLYGILKTPYRSDYGSLQELKGSEK